MPNMEEYFRRRRSVEYQIALSDPSWYPTRGMWSEAVYEIQIRKMMLIQKIKKVVRIQQSSNYLKLG